ncbi:MAG: glycosyltransferase, partial [Actinomycetota bacterium]|nr:glycosyltransferase [Actinomycetota bacterium]
MARVSVVMPVFDVAPFVEAAVRSMLAQTYRDLELIVVDDGSSDGTDEIVERIDDRRLRLIRADHGGYVAAARRGIEAASGELLTRADGDDLYLPELFARQIEVLDAHPRTAAVGAWLRQFGGMQAWWRTPADPEGIRRELRVGCPLSQPVLMRTDVYHEVGGLRPVRWEDWDLWIRVAAGHDLRNVPEVLVLRRYRPGSLYHGPGRVQRREANLEARRTAAQLLGLDRRSALLLAKNRLSLPLYRAVGRFLPASGPPSPTLIEEPAVSVVVPSYGRAGLLPRCLDGVEAQDPRADEVIVVFRREDRPTVAFLEPWTAQDPARRRMVEVHTPGIIPALAAGTEAARCPVVAQLDDDAVPRPGWIAELRRGFLDPSVGAVGGPFVDHVDGVPVTGRATVVGKVTWYGRVIGNHDRQTDHYGDVDILPGANVAYRRPLARHEPRLLHSSGGLALANELDACLTVKRLGYRVLFSPWAVVDHYTTSYRDPELGSRVSGTDVFTSAANYSFALLRFLPPWRRVAFRIYGYLVGSAMQPGPVRAVLEAASSPGRA